MQNTIFRWSGERGRRVNLCVILRGVIESQYLRTSAFKYSAKFTYDVIK